MSVSTLISVEEYLASAFHPDCDYVDGHLLERNLGKKRHSHTQGYTYAWFWNRRSALKLEPLIEQRIQVAEGRFRVPDLLLVAMPVPDEEVLTAAPYLCLEVMSPDDTMSSLQDRLDDYLALGVSNIWVIDPWKNRVWMVSKVGWHVVLDGVLRSTDGVVELPVAEVMPE